MVFGIAGWGFILCIAGLITLIGALAQIAKIRSFTGCSERITGTIAGRFYHHGNNRKHYSFDVEYTVDGLTYKRSVPADRSEYKTLDRGDSLELNYKPDNPKKVIRPAHLNDSSKKATRIIAIAAAALMVIGIAMIFSGVMWR